MEKAIITRGEFLEIINGVLASMENTGRPITSLFPSDVTKYYFGKRTEFSLDKLISVIENDDLNLRKSVSFKVVFVFSILSHFRGNFSFSNYRFSRHILWSLLYASLILDEQTEIYVGSQGFYDLTLYRYFQNGKFKVLRVHFWDKSSQNILDQRFKIHSHICYARSLVFKGEIENSLYTVKNAKNGELSLFKLKWRSPREKKMAIRTSYLVNTNQPVSCIKDSSESISQGNIYDVKEGSYHSSQPIFHDENGDMVITLFLFDYSLGSVEEGFILGPSGEKTSETKRSPIKNRNALLDRVDTIFKYG
ncbi:hypothetical protein [Flagellimonas sp. S3867]|uniref:hypothetical protein n=1 Tax=Flagellimonas sp. S3867 TaxID=2768063 RepID=UPI001682FD85|nr:hypothetical protein [Flagellimonas sp. S3867]